MAFMLLFTKALATGVCPDDFYPFKNGEGRPWLCPDPQEYVTCCYASWKEECASDCHKEKCENGGGWWIKVDWTQYPYVCEMKMHFNSRLLGVSEKTTGAEASQKTTGAEASEKTTGAEASQKTTEASQKTTRSDPSCLGGQAFVSTALKMADSMEKLLQDLEKDHVRNLAYIGEGLFEYEQAVALMEIALRTEAKAVAKEFCVLCTDVEKFVGQLLAKVNSVIDNIFNEEIIKRAKQITFEIGLAFDNLCSNQQGETTKAAPRKLGHGMHSGRNSCPVWLPQAQSQSSRGSLGYVCSDAGKICSYPEYNMTFYCEKYNMVWKETDNSVIVCPFGSSTNDDGWLFCHASQEGTQCITTNGFPYECERAPGASYAKWEMPLY